MHPRKLTWQWNIHHEWRCISYWKCGIFHCHVSFPGSKFPYLLEPHITSHHLTSRFWVNKHIIFSFPPQKKSENKALWESEVQISEERLRNYRKICPAQTCSSSWVAGNLWILSENVVVFSPEKKKNNSVKNHGPFCHKLDIFFQKFLGDLKNNQSFASWWFQPSWKILVKIGIFPK